MAKTINNDIDSRIIEFISEHHVMTLATSFDKQPYTCSCFYTYLKSENCFVFTTEDTTRHGKEMLQNNKVAGAIALETSIVGKIQGIQYTGIVFQPKERLLKQVKTVYLKQFPVAVLSNLHLWCLRPNFLKMTHNRLGFGKKLLWHAKNNND